ncbi:hypothetical protein AALP_AAs70859U000200 [Arabis alpina]|uniref:Uncharacterized protein n=1 Tax=Arabis alpina TaxID=50452 RepID=A0A087FWQ4_ARAAL|nr:hypothetical protein AALP_AAs70859U000200 [Arabis alpina]
MRHHRALAGPAIVITSLVPTTSPRHVYRFLVWSHHREGARRVQDWTSPIFSSPSGLSLSVPTNPLFSGDIQSEMERPRSFRNLAPRTTGSGKPPMLTTATTSAAPTTVPAPAAPTTAPASAKPTTAPASAKPTTAPASAKPTTAPAPCQADYRASFRVATDLVAALPALLPSDDNANREAKGKDHEGDDRKRSSDRVDVINVDQSRRGLGRDPLHLLIFLALVNKVGHKLEAEVEDLKKQIDTKNHELTDKAKEIVSLKAEARKSAAALLAEAEKSTIALAAAEEREQYSAAIVKKRDGELSKVVDRLRRADEQIQSFKRKFAHTKDKFDDLQGDPQSNMVYQVQRVANLDFVRLLLGLLDGHEPLKLEDELTFLTANVAEHARDEERFEQLMKSLHRLLHVLNPKVKVPAVVTHDRTLETFVASVGVADPSGSLLDGAGSRKAAVVGVDGQFSLIGGVGAEVTKSRIEDVAEGAETVRAPEEMRTDEDSQGPRIDALTEDPRVDDVFGETEGEALFAQVARPGVDEETVP